jgi:hypothetical protein
MATNQHRRRARRKAKAKAVLSGLFANDWRDLELKPLAERVHQARLVALERSLSVAEWRALDRMRDHMRSLEKFEQARHVAIPR